ncbi:hypothetical protein D3C78_1548330 [compost metagenome]
MAAKAAMPQPIRLGVFGMTRTTGTPSGSSRLMSAIVLPARIDTKVVAGVQAGAIAFRASSRLFGLTANSTSGAARQSRLLAVT